MTTRSLLGTLLGLALAATPVLGNTAQVTFNCLSVAIRPSSTTDFFGEDSFLGFSAAEDGSVNDELTPVDNSPRTHGTVMILELPGLNEPIIELLFLDVPDLEDADQNQVPDFWEVAKEVAGIESLGQFKIDDGIEVTEGTVAAVWNRGAGNPTGEVRIRIKTDFFDLTFRPDFEIWEYKGPMEYEVNGSKASATVDLTRQGAEGKFSGPLELKRISEVELHYPDAEWTNELGETLEVVSSTTLILQNPGTHYFDEVIFFDGIPSTPSTLEYALWLFDVVDPNDADGDQIPDLSDGPRGGTAKPAELELRLVEGQWKLKVSAPAGQAVIVEQCGDFPAAEWTEVRSFTVAAASEEIDVTPPSEGAVFWRARSP